MFVGRVGGGCGGGGCAVVGRAGAGKTMEAPAVVVATAAAAANLTAAAAAAARRIVDGSTECVVDRGGSMRGGKAARLVDPSVGANGGGGCSDNGNEIGGRANDDEYG